MSKDTIKLVICSVGGTPEPIMHTLKTLRPSHAIFFCSTASSDQIGNFIREVPDINRHEIITTENIEDLDVCLNQLNSELPEILNRWRINWDECIVDYTGGTKTMSSAIVLSTIHHGVRYAYVSGNERSKEGRGIVIAGTEKLLLRSNPWNTLAIKEKEDLCRTFNLGRYEEALEIAKQVSSKLSDSNKWKYIFDGLSHIIEGYRDWDRFQHKKAENKIKRGRSQIAHYRFDEPKLQELYSALDANITFLELFQKKENNDKDLFLIKDLLSNAIRRGDIEHKYDDAVARLYRSFELIGQQRLRNHYGIHTGKCQLEQIPETIRDEYKAKYWNEENNHLKFGLDASYKLLYELQDELGKKYMENYKEYSKLLQIRNHSILAHGLHPIDKNTYEKLKKIVLEFAMLEKHDLPFFPTIDL